MDREPWPSTYDRDLDVPRRQPTGPPDPIDPYRRLVVNPLLAVACGVGAIVILRLSLQSRNLTGFLTAIGLLGSSLLFTQLHCLDCGKTTWLLSSRRHACAPALARRQEGRLGRWPFPTARTQMIIWLHVIASVSALWVILFVLSHP